MPEKKYPIEINTGLIVKPGQTATIFSTGTILTEAIAAANALENHCISTEVINIHTIKPVFAPKRAGDVRRTYADIRKAKKMMKFKIQTRFYEGLKKTVAWFLAEYYG